MNAQLESHLCCRPAVRQPVIIHRSTTPLGLYSSDIPLKTFSSPTQTIFPFLLAISLSDASSLARGAGGGGLLGLEKGTNCGPTSSGLWLSRADMAKKKGGLSSKIFSQRVAVTVLIGNILDQTKIVFFLFIQDPQKYTK